MKKIKVIFFVYNFQEILREKNLFKNMFPWIINTIWLTIPLSVYKQNKKKKQFFKMWYMYVLP